jgi:Protein of unknown function
MTAPIETTTPAAAPPHSDLDEGTVDALILSSATAEWCKVAILIARAVDGAKAQGLEVASGVIVPRLYALAETGALETQGNVRRWRAGEVRLGKAVLQA